MSEQSYLAEDPDVAPGEVGAVAAAVLRAILDELGAVVEQLPLDVAVRTSCTWNTWKQTFTPGFHFLIASI